MHDAKPDRARSLAKMISEVVASRLTRLLNREPVSCARERKTDGVEKRSQMQTLRVSFASRPE
jgi:hypothetical protein